MESPFSTKAVILQALLEGAGYGSAVMVKVGELTKDKIALHSGSVYPALRALENEGLIAKKQGSGEIGRACVYYLTLKGRGIAKEHRSLAKLIFSSSMAA